MPRALHATAAKLGLLGIGFPEAVGGSGGDLLDSIIVTEEIIRAGGSSGLIAALFTHGIALPHIVAAGDRGADRPVRPARPWPGELIGALAVTEPDGGSDVAGAPHHGPPRRRPLRGQRRRRRSSPAASGPTS